MKPTQTELENAVAPEQANCAQEEQPRSGADLMREYISATEYWQLQPHDQKERRAWFEKLQTSGVLSAPSNTSDDQRSAECK